jgi:hypothetical protein
MVDDFYFCSKKSVVFLLSDGEEGGEKVMWRGSVDRSKRKRRERRSGREGNLKGSSGGSDVVLVVVFNTSPGVNRCGRGRESGHLNKGVSSSTRRLF